MPSLNAVTQVDPRGPRFTAAITAVVLAVTLVLGPTLGLPLLIIATFAFGAGSLLGLRYQPYGWVFRRFVRPRIAAPAELEDERPPRFAQSIGLGFTALGLIGAFSGVPALFYIAIGFALAAATLNALFDYCLGCELYLLGSRLLGKLGVPSAPSAGPGAR